MVCRRFYWAAAFAATRRLFHVLSLWHLCLVFCTWSFESLCQASLLILCGFCATVIGLSSDVSIFVVRSLVVVLQLGLFVVSDVIFSFKFFCSAMLASRAFLHVVWCSELLSAAVFAMFVCRARCCVSLYMHMRVL